MVNTEEEIMSKFIEQVLERLSEMFPDQSYQSKLERYIASRNPQNVTDVEHYEREYSSQQHRGLL